MDIVIKISQFILSFSLLVIIHELGHFLFARMFGIRVEKFYLFFNPWFSLFKFTYKGTEYGIGWVPFGGYVKIAGMIDESMDTDAMKEPAKPDEFRTKPAWQRLLVMVGGVLMNVILALCIYIGMSYAWGDEYLANENVKYGYVFSDLGREIGFRDGDKIASIAGEPATGNYQRLFLNIVLDEIPYVEVDRDGEIVRIAIGDKYTPQLLNSKVRFMEPRAPFYVHDVVKGGNADRAGMQAGDIPVAINGIETRFFDHYRRVFDKNKSGAVDITYERRNEAGETETHTARVHVSGEGMIGIERGVSLNEFTITTHKYTFFQAIPAGIKRAGGELSSYWKQIKMIFTPKTEAYKNLGGVIAIGNIFPSYWSWEHFWSITAFLSIVLAVMNILPIPALDGGHVLFLLYEVITRRKPSDKFMEYAQLTGLALLFALLIYANGNDIYKLFVK